MKAEQHEPTTTVFLQTVTLALNNLKQQLQHDYERAYPDLREIIHLVLEEEELRAWDLTSFPHLLFPDLVEAHIAQLNLQPLQNKRARAFAKRPAGEVGTYQPAFVLCG